MQRKIIHIDADCFYAALEVRDHPHLRGKAVAVGGSADRRGVISTCNYEARRFGVHSAMATATALRLCPDLVLMPHRFSVYREASRQMHEIFARYTDLIEPLSLDEAFLDVSGSPLHAGSATRIAEDIRQTISTTLGITVSAGVAPNKFLAKVASDWNKPDGLYVIRPERVSDFVVALPVKKIFGVGRVTAEKMKTLGLHTCGDLQSWSETALCERFGRFGTRLYALCRGRDDRPVSADRQRKSLSVEHTYPEDLKGLQECMRVLPELVEELTTRMARLESPLLIAGSFVKVKFSDFTTTTLARKESQPNQETFSLLLTEALARRDLTVRLLGVGIRLGDTGCEEPSQLSLFHDR